MERDKIITFFNSYQKMKDISSVSNELISLLDDEFKPEIIEIFMKNLEIYK